MQRDDKRIVLHYRPRFNYPPTPHYQQCRIHTYNILCLRISLWHNLHKAVYVIPPFLYLDSSQCGDPSLVIGSSLSIDTEMGNWTLCTRVCVCQMDMITSRRELLHFTIQMYCAAACSCHFFSLFLPFSLFFSLFPFFWFFILYLLFINTRGEYESHLLHIALPRIS